MKNITKSCFLATIYREHATKLGSKNSPKYKYHTIDFLKICIKTFDV